MIDKKDKELIEKLIQKSNNKQVIWSATSRANEYKVSLSKGAITTDLWTDDRDGATYADFIIRNERGDAIKNIIASKETDADGFKLLVQLNTIAKESYFKVDETIDDIFKELDSDEEIGKQDDLPF